VADTGELYIMGEPNVALSEDLFGGIHENRLPTSAVTVAVVGWIADRARVDQVLDGWQQAMEPDNSLVWLVERLRQQDVPRQPPG
jgi:hypothetical protein